jgi:hypothetical protein
VKTQARTFRTAAIAGAFFVSAGGVFAAPILALEPPPVPPARPVSRATLAAEPGGQAVDPATAAKAGELAAQGVEAYKEGRFSGAIEVLEKALLVDPRHELGLYYLANSYWRMEEYEKAADVFRRLVAAHPRGSFAVDAREWLSAQGSFDVIASRVKLQPFSGGIVGRRPPGATNAGGTYTLPDGRTRLDSPPGWARGADEVVKAADKADVYRTVFRKDLGGGQAGVLVVEAHHRNASPAPGTRKGVTGLGEIADRILGEQGLDDYLITRSKVIADGQELEFEAHPTSPVPIQGTIRGTWEGMTLVVTVASSPKSAWAGILKQVQPAVGSLKVAPGAPLDRPGVANAAGSAPSPTPASTPTPNVPTMLMPRPGEPTLPPGLYPAPWATPTPGR